MSRERGGDYVRLNDEESTGCLRAAWRRWRARRARVNRIEAKREQLVSAILGLASKFRETKRHVEDCRSEAKAVLEKARGTRRGEDVVARRMAKAEAKTHIQRALDLVEYAEKLSAIQVQMQKLLHTLDVANTNVVIHRQMGQASKAVDKLLDLVDPEKAEQLMSRIAKQGEDVGAVGEELADTSYTNGITDEEVEQELARLMVWDMGEVAVDGEEEEDNPTGDANTNAPLPKRTRQRELA